MLERVFLLFSYLVAALSQGLKNMPDMISIQKNEFEFQAENEAFVRTLYGQWDTFHRTSFEQIVDEVLSRYDTPDELIQIETLHLDIGTLTEADFYEHFPRLLAEKLDETFAAYLAHKDTHPGDIKIIPIKQSLLDKFAFYLLKGYLSWEEENRPWNLSDLLEEIIRSDAGGLFRLLQSEGGKTSVRERLVFQFPDADLERLTKIVVPSDAPFINAYAGFLIASHRRLQRPDLTVRDFRDGVWLVIWAYLLAESKGYYSRKQLVVYTLQGLSARYAIPLETLLDWMTAGVKEWGAVRLAAPELLVILSELREEQKADLNQSPDRRYASEVWIELLSVPESCRRFLRNLREERIYEYVRVVIPSEHVFVIRYAQTLDKEKERGMLEGKAGDEFRLLKWEFIFQVMLHTPAGSYARLQFAYSVLERLAAHYNVGVMELLEYFYRSLASGEVQADSSIRELIYALFLEHRQLLGCGPLSLFPVDLKETLENIHLCRLFLRPLPEEKIYLVVKEIIPAESPFIIQYARLLDKGKDHQALEGKAGEEFRILKWEFIFLVILGAPLSDFNRKQFTRAVLQQLAAHYNLTVKDLIIFFYENLSTEDWEVPASVRQVISLLYEEIEKESPESRLKQRLEAETQRLRLEELILKGRIETFLPAASLDSLYEFVKQMSRTEPSVLLEIIGRLRQEPLAGWEVKQAGSGMLFALLLYFVIRSYGLAFSRQETLQSRLADIEAHRRTGDASLLRLLLYHCIRNRMDSFQKVLDEFLRPAGDWQTPERIEGGLMEKGENEENRRQPAERVMSERFISERSMEEKGPAKSDPTAPALIEKSHVKASTPESPAKTIPFSESSSAEVPLVEMFFDKKEVRKADAGKALSGEILTEDALSKDALSAECLTSAKIVSERNITGKVVSESELTALTTVEKPTIEVLTRQKRTEVIFSSEPASTKNLEIATPETATPETAPPEITPPKPVIPKAASPKAVIPDAFTPVAVSLEVFNREAACQETSLSKAVLSKTAVSPTAPLSEEKLPPVKPPAEASPLRKKTDDAKASDQNPDRKEAALSFPYRWLSEHASASLRTVIEEVLSILSSVKMSIRETDWLPLLIDLATPSYRYYSRFALWQLFWDRLKGKLADNDRTLLVQTLRTHRRAAPGWIQALEKNGQVLASPPDRPAPASIYIRNAGLVLLAPFFPRLFGMLNLLDERKTLSERPCQIKAIYMTQYLATAGEKIPEYELFLNKLLTGYPPGESFPSFLEIEESDQQILLSLLNGVRQHWSKMKNTSIQGFRTSFLLRDGVLEEQDDKWLLTVDPRAYDVLLDTLPWTYSPVKFPWMMKPLYVKWL